MKFNRVIKRKILKGTTNEQKRHILEQLINENENMSDDEKKVQLNNLSKLDNSKMYETMEKVMENLRSD